MRFHLLAQERESGRYIALMVDGAANLQAASRLAESDSVSVVGARDSREQAVAEAQALNAAAGIVVPGCSNC